MSIANHPTRIAVFVAFCVSAWPQVSEHPKSALSPDQRFSASWWAQASPERRAGVLNGVSDCMTWSVHKKGFNQTPEQMTESIGAYYRAHREAAALSVVEVWQKLDAQSQFDTRADGQGETWKNAHLYLNGDWWTQSSEDQQLGFVEGYLWCLKTQAPTSTERYPETAKAYWHKIDAFVKAHPKLGNESVAVTLRRFRDR